MPKKESKYKLFICPLVGRMGKCKNTAGEQCAHRIPHFHRAGCDLPCDAGHTTCKVIMDVEETIPEIYF
jgi:hypothetical protein